MSDSEYESEYEDEGDDDEAAAPPALAQPLVRLQSTPASWELSPNAVCLSLDLRTCQLQQFPALTEGKGALAAEPALAPDDEAAKLPEALRGDDDELIDHDIEKDGVGGLVHLVASSNHASRLDSRSFAGVPDLRALDVSLNHIATVEIEPKAMRRLRTLVLANNKLRSLEALAPLSRLLHLDVSLNELESLAGVEALTRLVALAASGNRLRALPDALHLDALGSLKVLDLQHNLLEGAEALASLSALTTLKLSHNRLVAFAPLLEALSGLRIQQLTLYGNALTSAPTYPDALLLQQPWLETLDFVQLPPARLAEGGASRASLSEAVGSVVASALSQHAAQRAKMRAQHEALVEALKRQQEAATYALQEYMAVTSKGEKIFQDMVASTKAAREKSGGGVSGGGMGAVERLLQARQELLLNERVCHTAYDEKVAEARAEMRASRGPSSPSLRRSGSSPSKGSRRSKVMLAAAFGKAK